MSADDAVDQADACADETSLERGQLADTTHLKNLLEHAGIGSFIKNAYLGSAIGELPVYDATPELWVFRDADAAQAEVMLRDAMRPAEAPSGSRVALLRVRREQRRRSSPSAGAAARATLRA